MVVLSDLNASYGSTHYPQSVGDAVRLTVERLRPDLVLIAGDMIAGQAPQLPDSLVRSMWMAFDSAVAAPLRAAGIPILAALGNHDASAYPAHARDRRLAVEYWRGPGARNTPELTDGEHHPLLYSHRRGPVFIAVWDATTAESSTDQRLLNWLRAALESPQAQSARHRVVLGHLPMHAVGVGRDRPGEVLGEGDAFRELLEAWGATLYISGHHHAYFPGRRGRLGLLHAGALGDGPRQLLGSPDPPRRTVSVLDFIGDALAVTTYALDEGSRAWYWVPLESLPRAVCGASGWVARLDLIHLDTSCAPAHVPDGRSPAIGG